VNPDGRWRSGFEALALPAMYTEAAARLFPWLAGLPGKVRGELQAQALYAPYLERQEASLRMLEREERLAIPAEIDFESVAGLSAEMRVRLSQARPATLGGAGRVPGITPAALAALIVHLRQGEVRFT